MSVAITKLIVFLLAGGACIFFGILCFKGDNIDGFISLRPKNAELTQEDYDKRKISIVGGIILNIVGVASIGVGVLSILFPDKTKLLSLLYMTVIVLSIGILVILSKTVFKKKY